MGKVAVHGAVEFQSFPCAALFGKHVKDCSLSRNRIIISSKESIDSTGRSHGLCGYLRSDYSILYIPVVFSASNTNTFEDIPLQNRTVGDVPYCYFKYIDTRKGCKFTFRTLCVCACAWLPTCASIWMLYLWKDLKWLILALLLPFDIELSIQIESEKTVNTVPSFIVNPWWLAFSWGTAL